MANPNLVGDVTYDDFILREGNIVTDKVTIASGQNIAKYEVLGKITSGGKYATYDSTKGDGTETPDAIALEDMDATGGDLAREVYIGGVFNQNKLVFSYSGDSVTDALKTTLRDKGIYLKDSVGA